ncbi:SPOR domain-containing protein [Alteraurantiacibacter aquimixticola]|uniref:SPOR domain-containing protein n=1 Tax=Alteraurantiacibacter aquimixticola TaxID=2489173 RepID=A0A4T3F4Q4_9SPHN|nr:SPOR domain-containing protein [Alteraurantiacibacter aquimixticola]TIX51334.1 SPOR domain-containing protein [Alteraurantiacibacter aquimixticola]
MSWPNGDEGKDDAADLGADSTYEADEQLALSDDDDALPWLESDEDYEEEGGDYRILIFGAVAVLMLAGILFGVSQFLGSSATQGEIVADGSTIEAPDEPYKMRPEDPGGTEVAGTGDVSFQVGEGQETVGQLAAGEVPSPSIDVDQQRSGDETPAPAPAPSPSPTQAALSGVGVQVGAFSTRQSAESGWSQLSNRYSVLQGHNHRIIEGRADSGVIYRLQAVTANADAADALCRSIRNAGGDCQVKR